MSNRAAELAVDVVSDVSKATAGLNDVGNVASSSAADVAKLGNESAESARKIALSADAADELGGKAGKATGALGALGSGFELVGAEKYAGALQSASMATDFLSGVGDSLNLVMESTIAKNIQARAATLAKAVAEKTAAAGTAVLTAGQWALNAAMSANPIALVVIALVALVAGLILAYKKSATVRAIVQDVGKVGSAAIGWITDEVSDLVGWLDHTLPGGLNTAKNAGVLAFKVMTIGPRTLIKVVGWAVDNVHKLPEAFDNAREKAGDIAHDLTQPFRDLYNLVGDIIDKIKSIKLPKVPDINPFSRMAAGVSIGGDSGSDVAVVQVGGDTYNYNFNGAILGTEDGIAKAVQRVVPRRTRRFGFT